MKLVNVTIALLAAAGLAGSAAADNQVKQAAQDAKKGAFDLFDKNSATVDFDKGASNVSDGERSDLKAVVDAVKSDARIAKVVVAAWSDNDAPTGKDQKLSQADQDLAKARGDKVKESLSQLGVNTVEVYSMAEYPSWIARTFNTKDAKLKGAGSNRSTDDAVLTEIGREIRETGGPGKAVAFVLHEGEALSH